MELRWLTPDDAHEVVAAGHLFDEPARPDQTQRFLANPAHHLCLASVEGVAAGFVTGVEIAHPDKDTEMCLYELGVDDDYRRQGIGRALVDALGQRARDTGCTGMWVLTETENTAAMATYRSAGAGAPTHHVMLDWTLTETDTNG